MARYRLRGIWAGGRLNLLYRLFQPLTNIAALISPNLNSLTNEARFSGNGPNTVTGILRHSKIQTTLGLYTQDAGDETRATRGEFLTAVRMSTPVN